MAPLWKLSDGVRDTKRTVRPDSRDLEGTETCAWFFLGRGVRLAWEEMQTKGSSERNIHQASGAAFQLRSHPPITERPSVGQEMVRDAE